MIKSIDNEWFDIPGYSNYKITKSGLIKILARQIPNRWGTFTDKPEMILKPSYPTVKGKPFYPVYGLLENGIKATVSIHSLIAKTFIPNPNNRSEINHIDGVKTNFSLSNLEWCTRAENSVHAIQTGLRPKSSLCKQVIDLTSGFIYDSIYQFASAKNIDRPTASYHLRVNNYEDYKLISNA